LNRCKYSFRSASNVLATEGHKCGLLCVPHGDRLTYLHLQSGLFSSWEPHTQTGYRATKRKHPMGCISMPHNLIFKRYYQNRVKTQDMVSTVGTEALLVSTACIPVLGPTSLLCKWVSGALCSGVGVTASRAIHTPVPGARTTFHTSWRGA